MDYWATVKVQIKPLGLENTVFIKTQFLLPNRILQGARWIDIYKLCMHDAVNVLTVHYVFQPLHNEILCVSTLEWYFIVTKYTEKLLTKPLPALPISLWIDNIFVIH